MLHPLGVDDLRIDTADTDHAATTTMAASKILGSVDVRAPRLEADSNASALEPRSPTT